MMTHQQLSKFMRENKLNRSMLSSAASQTANPAMLEQLARVDDWGVLKEVARNIYSPPNAWESIASHIISLPTIESRYVVQTLQMLGEHSRLSPQTCEALVLKLAKHRSSSHLITHFLPGCSNKFVLEFMEADPLMAVMALSSASPQNIPLDVANRMLDFLFVNKDQLYRDEVLIGAADRYLISSIISRGSADDLITLLNLNEFLQPEDLDHIAKKANLIPTYREQILSSVSSHSNASDNLILGLVDDNNANVSSTARKEAKRRGLPGFHTPLAVDFLKPADTSSPQFQRWFHGSKIVNSKGEPLVVFHGTNHPGFTQFDLSRIDAHHPGFFFTNSLTMASTYVDPTDTYPETWPQDPIIHDHGHIYRVFLRMTNPFVWDAKGMKWNKLQAIEPGRSHRITASQVGHYAKRLGYDGAIITNVVDTGPHSCEYDHSPETNVYIVFSPNQIKSATGNIGQYSLTDDDIRHNPARLAGRRVR